MSTAQQLPSPQWLERANRLSLVGRVLTGTVHDVNNALQVVGGSAELLQVGSIQSEAAVRRVAAIGVHSQRATGLLADLTSFVKEVESPVAAVDLIDVAECALVLRRHSLNRLQLAPVIEGERVRVEACRRRVLQIVLNLIINAERALAGVRGGALRLTVAHDDGCGSFTVADNGPGFPAEQAEAIFEARLWRDGPVDDLGIGLCVSRWLAGRDHGTLTAVSTPAAGAAFTLRLPVSRC
ncbi:MAG: HAMP domain-containing sensor histidine kinase [Vicinamibacterales bacterium]|jgi:signal transduction histidine kinase